MVADIQRESHQELPRVKLSRTGKFLLIEDYQWPGKVIFLKGAEVPRSIFAWDYVVLQENEMTDVEFHEFLHKQGLKFNPSTRILEMEECFIDLPDYPK